ATTSAMSGKSPIHSSRRLVPGSRHMGSDRECSRLTANPEIIHMPRKRAHPTSCSPTSQASHGDWKIQIGDLLYRSEALHHGAFAGGLCTREVAWGGSRGKGACRCRARQQSHPEIRDILVQNIRVNHKHSHHTIENNLYHQVYQREGRRSSQDSLEKSHDPSQRERHCNCRNDPVNHGAPAEGPPDSRCASECGRKKLSSVSATVRKQADPEQPEVLAQDISHYEKRSEVIKEVSVIPQYEHGRRVV